MFDISQLTECQIYLLIVITGALILYFGKLISDTKVEKYDRLGFYIEGLFFFIIYVAMPLLVAYYLIIKSISLPMWSTFLIQLIVLGILTWNLIVNEYFWKHGLSGEFENELKKQIDNVKKSDTTKGKIINNYEEIFKKKFGMDYTQYNFWLFYKIPKQYFGNKNLLFILSFLSLLSSMSLFFHEDVLFFLISMFLTFFILSLIAISYGFKTATYPSAIVYLDEGEPIEGKILKFGDYVYLLKEGKKIFINNDKIKYIEENLIIKKGEGNV